MYTLGFRFRPWTERQSIADGKPDPRLHQEHRGDVWHRQAHPVQPQGCRRRLVERRSSLDPTHRRQRYQRSDLLLVSFLCSGYYNYEQGYSPKFPGSEDFSGPIIHPQHWPEDLDYTDKNVVVIGSGSTSVTLVPALADSGAKHVTMLQRSPTYIISQPDQDPIAAKIHRWLPEDKAYTIIRWKNVVLQVALYQPVGGGRSACGRS